MLIGCLHIIGLASESCGREPVASLLLHWETYLSVKFKIKEHDPHYEVILGWFLQ